jgi:hypothetical protein
MHGSVPLDPETNVSNIEYAVVYVPRKSRNRFAASCVDIKSTAADAIDNADPDNKHFAARISGPSRSSEGQYIYYLIEWLDQYN